MAIINTKALAQAHNTAISFSSALPEGAFEVYKYDPSTGRDTTQIFANDNSALFSVFLDFANAVQDGLPLFMSVAHKASGTIILTASAVDRTMATRDNLGPIMFTL